MKQISRTSSVDTVKAHPIIIEPTTSPKVSMKQPKSILVKKTSDPNSSSRKRSPKLLHSNSLRGEGDVIQIYAQSATDVSATEDDVSERSNNSRKTSAPALPMTLHTNGKFLQVPSSSEMSGLRKSKSFASPGQYECAISDKEVNAKQKTIMAFFDASLAANAQPVTVQGHGHPVSQASTGPVPVIPKTVASAVIRRSSAAAIHQKRGSITSISDEILGDDDLKDVDAVFESLLNSTFQEIQARGREAASRRGGAKQRSASSHPTVTRSSSSVSDSVGSAPKAENSSAGKSSNKRGAVNRKQSRNKLVAGEVKSVIQPSDQQQQQQQQQHHHHQDQSMNKKEVLADPLAALPTSHTKKYLPRQQSWASNPSSPLPPISASSNPNTLPPPPAVQTPSPTQSEYDTCPDPWEDY